MTILAVQPTNPTDEPRDWQAAGQKLWARAQELAGSSPKNNEMFEAWHRARAEHPAWADVYDRKQLAPPQPARGNNAIESPPRRADAAKVWKMLDARGNLIIGSDTSPAIQILRDPTPAEASAAIERRMEELQRSGEAATAHDARRMALRDLPLAARVYLAV
jgi:hypothetical protein